MPVGATKRFVGLMSGTSLDGLDIAICEISGADLSTSLHVTHFTTLKYSDAFKANIYPIFAQANARLEDVCNADALVAETHAKMLLEALNNWGLNRQNIDVIASHGQTILHSPQGDYATTVQIGDGDRIAQICAKPTLSDFRQKHIAAGGEGAPLVPYADYLLFSSKTENRLLLNIGGIANFTFLPKNTAFDSVLCTDTGPGNTLMDAVIAKHSNGDLAFDPSGEFAKQGEVNMPLLSILLTDNFFQRTLPKSTGQELFNIQWLEHILTVHNINLAVHDLMATLNMFTAKSIALALSHLNTQNYNIYVSGGGIHNPVLLANLSKELNVTHENGPIRIYNSDELGINADAKEAALFAVLANQTLFGNSAIFGGNKTMPAVSMGKISLP